MTANGCGRQDSNPYGLSRYPLSARGSLSSGSQSRRVCRFHHARVVRGFLIRRCSVVGGVGLPDKARPTPPLPPRTAVHCCSLCESSYSLSSVAFAFRTHLPPLRTNAPEFLRLSIVAWMTRKLVPSSRMPRSFATSPSSALVLGRPSCITSKRKSPNDGFERRGGITRGLMGDAISTANGRIRAMLMNQPLRYSSS